MRRLIRWLRFRGWRNAYWREDAISAACHHDESWADDDGFVYCAWCGSLLRIEDETGSSNVTQTVEIVVP